MGYKIKNPYKHSHIMDLNLLELSQNKMVRFSRLESTFLVLPIISVFCAVLAVCIDAGMGSDFSFIAQCQNISGGDVCSIALR